MNHSFFHSIPLSQKIHFVNSAIVGTVQENVSKTKRSETPQEKLDRLKFEQKTICIGKNPEEPLSDEKRKRLQEIAEEIYKLADQVS